MAGLPTGTLTFLFTDVEGSTPLWERAPDLAAAAMRAHDRLLREQLDAHEGMLVKGTGDGALAVFSSPLKALSAALGFQLALLSESGLRDPPAVRVALHTGEALVWDDDYHGFALAQCHRVLSAIHGHQICLTAETARALPSLPQPLTLKGLGRYVLRGTGEPITLYQVGHPHLPSDFPPLRALEAFAHNLPNPLTTFVGRTDEIGRIGAAIRESRLVSLVGSGGGGKSRLAIEIARSLLGEFPEGVWLVELASLSDPTLVARSIGRVMGVSEERGRSDIESLTGQLADRRQLLVLDNCEHLLAACADVTSALLTNCPRVKVLATSRQRLGVSGEVVFVVPPMAAPPVAELDSPSAVARSEAVQLFIDRARLTAPGFRLDTDNCRTVGRICRSLDGIPLAIELAAGRLSTLSLDEIATSLGQSIRLLGGGTGPERHRTLQGTLEWSHHALSPVEQRLFADLSVFRGGFDVARAAAVIPMDELGADPLEAAIALVEKSMLSKQGGSDRLHHLEPMRLFARDMLQRSGRTAWAERRHAAYVTGVVREGALQHSDDAGGRWMDLMATEHDNVRVALQWGVATGEWATVLEIAARSWPFWKHRGHVSEGRRWLGVALENAREADPTLLSTALLGAGDLAATQDDRAAAESALSGAVETARRCGDDATVAAALMAKVSIPYRNGDLAEATRCTEEALAVARRAENPSQIASILASLALLDEDQGRLVSAEAHAAEALSMRKRAADRYGLADALLTWGEICTNRGRHGLASEALEEARDIAIGEGYQDIEAWSGAMRGRLEMARGNDREGSRLLEESLVRFQERQQPAGEIWAMGQLGGAMLLAGDLDQAEALLTRALELSLAHVVPDAPQILETLGAVALARGHLEDAGFRLAMARRARQDLGQVLAGTQESRSAGSWAEVAARLGHERLAAIERRAADTPIRDARAALALMGR